MLCPAIGDRIQVSKGEFDVDRLDIPSRIDAVVHMDDVPIVKTAHHMGDDAHLSDGSEEAVAQPLSLGCPGYQACDIHKLKGRRNHLLGRNQGDNLVQTGIRNGNDAHIGVDCTERIVRNFGRSCRQGGKDC
ncbi:hypothetical protein SDC9_123776 [bioreactor metagenome]|uniref:Uncharacterized protein n=1 Tax=bioreactor metagenome TaxID=1076179 RepID=A0A645CIJ6_9ZZZZ